MVFVSHFGRRVWAVAAEMRAMKAEAITLVKNMEHEEAQLPKLIFDRSSNSVSAAEENSFGSKLFDFRTLGPNIELI